MEDEKRGDQRRRTLKRGQIEYGGSTVACTVRNQSASGAMLELEGPAPIPRHFVLTIVTESMQHRCRLVWVRDTRLGVRFEKSEV